MTKREMKKIEKIEKSIPTNKLLEIARKHVDDVLLEFNTSKRGVADEEVVEENRENYGENIISSGEKESILKKLFDAFINPFTVVLLILSIISYITDVVMAAPGERDYTAVAIVLIMVTVSGLLRFVQEARSGNEAEKLKAMVKVTVNIERQYMGKKEIPLEEVVVGDIIHLSAGDMIPADLRIIQSKDLFVGQSALTGESEPVEKLPYLEDEDCKNHLECSNLAFMGSNVISGSASGVVISVGDDTVFGKVAKSVSEAKPETSFEKGVNSVSWLLIRFMSCMVPVVFFVNGFTKGDWMQAFLFALSVAVGLTPEMLPMIVTTNLAKGAVKMSKQKTVIKNLNSIQNFGAMDILCTDKTGTLTQDKVVLEYHLDIHGNTDDRILRHAFLNSHYQTGLKNLMDIAILEHSEDFGFDELTSKYTKVDEIPFDFNRRRMSVVIRDKNAKSQMITKGAVEEMLSISTWAEYRGQVVELTKDIKSEILSTVDRLNRDGMRVIGVAQKTNPSTEGLFGIDDESDMVLMGYLAFLDPPKETTEAAIIALNNHGVDVKVLTGDNDAVTRAICKQVGLEVDNLLLGSDIEEMTEAELSEVVEKTTVFAKLSPMQKVKIVKVLRENGHTVGFMGDGINDAAAMKESDVGISVDTAVDIAKESADIILLEKDLTVLEQGVIEGRRTFANIVKYIKMTTSSNFGNMFSILVASAFLPFLPMIPIQILVLNLIYDISCISMPWDNVDEEYILKPRNWDTSSMSKFMVWIGPTSSVFDIVTYAVMYFVICPAVLGGHYGAAGVDKELFAMLFTTGWFVESIWSQTLVIHMIRTPRLPFIHSRASMQVTMFTTLGIVLGTVLPYTSLGEGLSMYALPAFYFAWLAGIILGYMVLVTIVKKIYIRRYGEFL
ncbi:MAG: magnesium-translocating P-type ATPase [Clostridioides sp.]|jgi:Mg2+-importing ATPase|nr:magnesium-translocating P-type ATPase [Clostridioides sp.]